MFGAGGRRFDLFKLTKGLMFFSVTLAGAVDFNDQLITDWGGTTVWARYATEFAPTILTLAYSSDGNPHEINIYLAARGGAFGTEDVIPLISVNALTIPATANYATIMGGQGGCRRAWRDEGVGIPMELRCTTSGKSDAATIRVEWQIGIGVTTQ